MCAWKQRLGVISLIVCAWAAPPAAQTISPSAKASDLIQVPGSGLKGPMNLNTASNAALQHLPNMSNALVNKIIAGRPYASVDDLAKVGIAKSTIDKIRPFVTATPAPTASAQPSTTKPRVAVPDLASTSGLLPR
jgi:competence protein ComEA